MATCMLCASAEQPLYAVCRCDTLVHEACFLRMVDQCPTHRHHCPVCRHTYPLRTARRRCVPSADIWEVAAAYVLVAIMLAASVACSSLLPITGGLYDVSEALTKFLWVLSACALPAFHAARVLRRRQLLCCDLRPVPRMARREVSVMLSV